MPISLATKDMVEGLPQEFDAEILDIYFTCDAPANYKKRFAGGSQDGLRDVVFLKAWLKMLSGSDEGEEKEQYWSTGLSIEEVTPSDKDENPMEEGYYVSQRKDVTTDRKIDGLGKGSNAGMFITSMVKHGAPEISGDVGVDLYKGVRAHFRRVNREGVAGEERVDEKGNKRPLQVVCVDRIIKAPWDKAKTAASEGVVRTRGARPSPASRASAPAGAPDNPAAATAATAPARASVSTPASTPSAGSGPAKLPSLEDLGLTDEDVQSKAVDIMASILSDVGSIPITNCRATTIKYAMKEPAAVKAAIVRYVTDAAWLSTHGFNVTDGVVTL